MSQARPCAGAGWQETVSLELPEPKEQVMLRVDRALLRLICAQGHGYQTRVNAVLRSYYPHERRKEP